MTRKNVKNLTYSDVPSENSHSIKNFFISNSEEKNPDFSLDYPFSFEGFVFCIITRGIGTVRINFKEYSFHKNTIVTVLPKQIVEKVFCSDDYICEILSFSPDLLTDMPLQKEYGIPRKISSNPSLPVSDRDMQNILRYYKFIEESFNRDKKGPFFDQIIRGHLFSFLHEIITLYTELEIEENEKPSSRNEEITERFINLLISNYKEGRSAAYYADKMCLTPKYLSAVIKKVTGRPVNSWIEDMIIIVSKSLLKSTNSTILQISEDLNFPNASYFARFFKKKTGMTPKDYRES